MELDKETGSTQKWECCPVELLCLIFRKLDTESLVKCMYICRSWNSVALYTAEKQNLWEKIVNKYIVDNGQMVKKKSLDMSWTDIFESSMLWSHCDKAEVLVHKTYSTVRDVNHVHVYKDNLIIASSSGVKYLDLTKSEFKRDIKIECIDFLENDNIILKVTPSTEIQNFKTLYLYGKKNHDDFNILKSNEKVVDKILHYRLDKEGCYVIDNRALLTLYKPKGPDWNEISIARYYGSYEHCSHLHIFKNNPYILLKMCHIDCVNDQSAFEGVLNVWYPCVPIIYVEMFHKFGVIYGVETSKEFCFVRKVIDGHKVFVMQCPGLTCATEHGEMLLLGYSNGKIEFFLPREVNVDAALKRQYNVTGGSKTDDNCVVSIDVYEEKERHHVFVATRTQLYHLLLKHTIKNGYLWTEYPDRISLADDFLIRSDDI